ncbi:hypothetical protein NDN08_003134 [Rhodosorus marinus]|uniref:Uncharacterized protein n=1 Tax=Rhodosorus marinus TaxID=101924 RepID=A0AAV8V1G8_9RHOD|nr:hypothetical protein NDN08_003134 [Rhodosorus marinus]
MMSEVLTLKAGAKRTFEAMDLDKAPVTCPQRSIKFLSPRQNEKKRTRRSKEMRDDSNNTVLKRLRSEPLSQLFSSSDARLGVIDKHVPRRRAQSNGTEKCYSLDDVRELLRKVLKEREVQLEKDFGNFLCTSLDEQAEEFIKFNEAYIARQFRKNSEMSYVS